MLLPKKGPNKGYSQRSAAAGRLPSLYTQTYGITGRPRASPGGCSTFLFKLQQKVEGSNDCLIPEGVFW